MADDFARHRAGTPCWVVLVTPDTTRTGAFYSNLFGWSTPEPGKGLGALGSMTSVPRLRNALGADHWWVRFYAAVALAELGEPGHAALRAAEADPEPTVRDMARYLIARGPLLPALP